MLLLTSFSATCFAAKTESTKLTTKGLEIKANISAKLKTFDNGKSKIEGKVTITNRTSVAQKYGNEFLRLTVNGKFVSRTYKDSVASEVIDFSVVEIKPRSSLSLPVYWVFELPTATEITSFRLSLDEKGVEKAEGITRPYTGTR